MKNILLTFFAVFVLISSSACISDDYVPGEEVQKGNDGMNEFMKTGCLNTCDISYDTQKVYCRGEGKDDCLNEARTERKICRQSCDN